MTLQEFQNGGNCEGCTFHQIVDRNKNGEPIKGCTFRWFDNESEDWEYGKNCDDMEEG